MWLLILESNYRFSVIYRIWVYNLTETIARSSIYIRSILRRLIWSIITWPYIKRVIRVHRWIYWTYITSTRVKMAITTISLAIFFSSFLTDSFTESFTESLAIFCLAFITTFSMTFVTVLMVATFVTAFDATFGAAFSVVVGHVFYSEGIKCRRILFH
jgi:hypothetical protein